MLALTNREFSVAERSCPSVMRAQTVYLTGLLALLLGMSSASAAVQVVRISDGDTLTISTGEKVRFLQIDTPEISPSECYGAQAHKALISLIGKSSISLEADSVSDDQDQFGRKLRYVKVGKTNLNLKLVQIGAATPYFHQGEKGKYASQLLKAAENAKAKKLGLWKMCPNTKLEPLKPATTGPALVFKAPTRTTSPNATCDPNYQGCVPPYPPDLDCTDIKRMGLAPVRVIGTDVHKLDGDGDGIGCDK
jgi:endonuclease YncB( thermonuclease family)